MNGSLTATDQIISKPVCISFYGSPTMYNTSGTLQTSGFTTTNQVFNLLFSSYTNQNWTPTYTSSCKLAVPYTGLYALQFTLSSNSNCSVCQFISKNMGNGNEVLSLTNDNLIATSSVTLLATIPNSISGLAYLTTSDYICFSIWPSSGSISYYMRNLAQVTLLQRTA